MVKKKAATEKKADSSKKIVSGIDSSNIIKEGVTRKRKPVNYSENVGSSTRVKKAEKGTTKKITKPKKTKTATKRAKKSETKEEEEKKEE